MEKFVEAPDAYGITSSVSFENEQIVTCQSFDAEPDLEQAAVIRQQQEGKRWGDRRHVGVLPMAFVAKIMAIPDKDDRRKAVKQFFRENPAFCTFGRYLR